MKRFYLALAVLAAAVLSAGVPYGKADPNSPPLIVPNEQGGMNALSMKSEPIMKEFYIGLHDSSGNCTTKVIKARNTAEALAEGQRSCSDCTVYNFTDNFKSGNKYLVTSTLRYCPLSK